MLSDLPRPIRLLVVGGAATIVLVVGAVALRSGDGLEEPASPADDAPSDVASALAAPSATPTFVHDITPKTTTPNVAPGGSAEGSAREIRARLEKHLQMGRYKDGVADIDALLRADPKAAEDGELRGTIVDLAMRIMVGEGPECDQLFDLVSQRMGTRGIDILYEFVTTRGGSRAAKRADDLLKSQEVRERGTPALRIAWELRTASCDQKPALLARAKTEGDGRTLGQLHQLNQECRRRGGGCCLKKDPRIREAIDALKARLP